jgi:hypothetical protein
MLSNTHFGELLPYTCPITHTTVYHFITHLYFCAEIGGRLLDGVSGSNPAGVMDVCFFGLCWRADNSSRGVLTSVCVCVRACVRARVCVCACVRV